MSFHVAHAGLASSKELVTRIQLFNLQLAITVEELFQFVAVLYL
jgi:hypothetical protein